MNKIFWGLLLYFVTTSVFAETIMQIVPQSSPDPVTRSGGTTTVDFRMRNNSGKTLTQITVDPDFGISSGVSGITLSADACTGASVVPLGTCDFTVEIQGNTTLPNKFVLSPRVCAFNNSVCSQPSKTDRPEIIVVRQAYVANAGTNTVAVCDIDSTNAQITGCEDATPMDFVFNAPIGLYMTSDGTKVYVTNSGSGATALCTVDPATGKFSACETTGITLESATDIELNPAETFAYISVNSSFILVCEIDQDDGTFDTCGGTGGGFSGPTSVVFNSEGTLAYITNSITNTVSVCNANANTGALSGCAPSETSGTVFTNPTGIDLSGKNNLAFVTNYLSTSNSISTCKIPNLITGALGDCSLSTQSISNPYGLVLNPNNSFLYVTQPSSNSIYLCNVNSSGVLSNCNQTITGGNLSSPMGIVLN